MLYQILQCISITSEIYDLIIIGRDRQYLIWAFITTRSRDEVYGTVFSNAVAEHFREREVFRQRPASGEVFVVHVCPPSFFVFEAFRFVLAELCSHHLLIQSTFFGETSIRRVEIENVCDHRKDHKIV